MQESERISPAANAVRPSSRSPRERLSFGRIALLVLVAVSAAAVWHSPWARHLHPDAIEAHLRAAGGFAPIVFMLMMAMAVVVSPIPSLPLDLAAGSFFGPWLGTLYAALGAWIGAMTSFLLARFLGRSVVERFLSGHINFCRECSDRLLTRIVFVSRLVPVLSFDVVSYGAGLTNMSSSKFGLATLFGMLPLTFIYVSLGAAFVARSTLTVALGLAVVAGFFVLPRLIETRNFLSLRAAFRHQEPGPADRN